MTNKPSGGGQSSAGSENNMKVEVVDTATMDTVNEYEIRRGF